MNFPNAACRDHDPNLWFTPSRRSPNNDRAIAICNTCPHQTDCLAYSLEYAHDGIWGGKTAAERDVIRRRRGLRIIAA